MALLNLDLSASLGKLSCEPDGNCVVKNDLFQNNLLVDDFNRIADHAIDSGIMVRDSLVRKSDALFGTAAPLAKDWLMNLDLSKVASDCGLKTNIMDCSSGHIGTGLMNHM